MTPLEYALLALSSRFVIIDPIATVPAFLAMTPTETPEARVRMARLACQVAACRNKSGGHACNTHLPRDHSIHLKNTRGLGPTGR
jgi:hypothetical protein